MVIDANEQLLYFCKMHEAEAVNLKRFGSFPLKE